MKTLNDAQALKRAFIGGKLKSLPDTPQLENKQTWQRKKGGNVVVDLPVGKPERYRGGYTGRVRLSFPIVLYCADVHVIVDIRFYGDIKI